MSKEAREKEDSIIAKIRVGEFDILRDKTRLSEFIDEIYLPYCRLKIPATPKKRWKPIRSSAFSVIYQSTN